MDSRPKKLSIIMPAYNEEKTIGEIVRKVMAVKIDKELIIVDDGSVDKTREEIKKIVKKFRGQRIKTIFHPENYGKGAALRTGLKFATGDMLIIQDADLEYNPRDYKRLIKPIKEKKAKVVYGSRLMTMKLKLFGKNKTPLPLHYLANRFLAWMTNLLYHTHLTDMETCYKLFTREVYRQLTIKANRFDFEPEITIRVAKLGYPIHEIPIKTKPRSWLEGKKITWKDGLAAAFTLLKYKFVDL